MNIKRYETNSHKFKFLNETNNLKFNQELGNIENDLIIIYPEIKYQKIIGFGGAFTESAAYCFSKLSSKLKKQLINDYFSCDGINYSLARIPIGSCDFSLSSYSYSNKSDLSDFSIAEDRKYIIPFLKDVLKNNDLSIIATPWSPPAFMKDNKKLINGGKILDEYKQLWANYLVKYLKEYKKDGIDINYITVQNEPNASQQWESCQYTALEEQKVLKDYIIPTFIKNKIETEILIWDHNKEKIIYRTNEIFNDKYVEKYVSGIGYHYYSGDYFENIAIFNKLYSNKLMLHTEGCTGYEKSWLKKQMRAIPNAEIYAHDIIGDLNAGANGYIDWNLVLDYYGGPTHIKNSCNAPIMLNKKEDNYEKKLTYYYIGHFSKFIKKDATRIAHCKYTDAIEVTTFINTDKSLVVVVLNKEKNGKKINICLNKKIFEDYISEHSIVTYVIDI